MTVSVSAIVPLNVHIYRPKQDRDIPSTDLQPQILIYPLEVSPQHGRVAVLDGGLQQGPAEDKAASPASLATSRPPSLGHWKNGFKVEFRFH